MVGCCNGFDSTAMPVRRQRIIKAFPTLAHEDDRRAGTAHYA